MTNAAQTQLSGITDKQHKYIVDLVAQRPTWIGVIKDAADRNVVADVLVNQQLRLENRPGAQKFIPVKDASRAISALLGVKPTPAPTPTPAAPTAAATQPTPYERLQLLLNVIPLSRSVKFALEIDGKWHFFAVDHVKKGGSTQRWVRELLGAPGNWNRKLLSVEGQLKIARLIAVDWRQAAEDYATKHGRCARCDAHLSDERSRAAKAGWKCAKEWGWPW